MDYQIKYSQRKSVGIKIKDGAVIVSAPYGTKKSVIDGIVKKHSEWIAKVISREAELKSKYTELSESEIKALRKSARTYFSEKCREYALVMGLEYNRISITGAKTRFGSCSSQKNICFSYRLMLYPEEAREYVIVHELAHLVEMNHSHRFYAIIERYMPDYKARRKLLKTSSEDSV